MKIKKIFPETASEVVLFISIPVSLVIVYLMLSHYYQLENLKIAKNLCAISVLWPIAESDYKCFKIPNKLILYGILLRVLILFYEIIFAFDTLKLTFISEGIAIIASAVVCIACILMSKGSMGMGDLKMLLMVGSLLGLEGWIYSLMFSVVISFVVALLLLLTKKKSKKDAIPFAPFVLAGSLLSMILSGV